MNAPTSKPGEKPVVLKTENVAGGSGPDFAVVTLRSGHVLEVGDEGINVHLSRKSLHAFAEPTQSLSFREPGGPPDSGAVAYVVLVLAFLIGFCAGLFF